MASGNTLVTFDAVEGRPPTSAPARVGERNNQFHYAFSPSTIENLVFRGIMPQHYGGGGVNVHLHTRSSATSGNFIFNTAFERQTGQDTGSDGFATAQAATTATNGSAGIPNGGQMDSVVAGDAFRLLVTRDATNVSDTVNSNDLELTQIEIREV
jgi:hypothetical protein